MRRKGLVIHMKKWKIAIASFCVVCLFTVAYAATAGSSGDPLVTLSYLNGVFTGKVQTMVDDTVTQRQTELEKALSDVIANGNGGSAPQSTLFASVTLKKGQAIEGSAGCEILLRSGSAACDPAILDTTAGAQLNSGGALTANHLYLLASDNSTVIATSDSAVFLVRGAYEIG